MKRIVTLIVAAFMMTVATNSFAQMSVDAGVLHANDQISLKGIDPVDMGMNGFYAGVSYNLPIVGFVGITPGLYYSMLFSNDSEFNGQLGAKVREHFINVPVYLNVGFGLGENARLFVFAGPTAQIGLASTIEVSVAGNNSPKVDRYDNNNYSRTNLLLGGGLGLNLYRFQITAGFDQGLFNLDTSNDGTKWTKSYAKAGIAYLF